MANLRQHKRYTMRRTRKAAWLRSATNEFAHWWRAYVARFNEATDDAEAGDDDLIDSAAALIDSLGANNSNSSKD